MSRNKHHPFRVLDLSQVLSGHQPHGDAAVVIRRGNFTQVAADTSYSVHTKWPEEEEVVASSQKRGVKTKALTRASRGSAGHSIIIDSGEVNRRPWPSSSSWYETP